jgi:hypothetical protein
MREKGPSNKASSLRSEQSNSILSQVQSTIYSNEHNQQLYRYIDVNNIDTSLQSCGTAKKHCAPHNNTGTCWRVDCRHYSLQIPIKHCSQSRFRGTEGRTFRRFRPNVRRDMLMAAAGFPTAAQASSTSRDTSMIPRKRASVTGDAASLPPAAYASSSGPYIASSRRAHRRWKASTMCWWVAAFTRRQSSRSSRPAYPRTVTCHIDIQIYRNNFLLHSMEQ